VAAAIGGTGRDLAGTELAPRAARGAQLLSGTTACAHLRGLGSSPQRARLGATSSHLAQKKAHASSLRTELAT